MASKLRCPLIPRVAASVGRSLAWPEGMARASQWGPLEARHVDGLLPEIGVAQDPAARVLWELDSHQEVTPDAGEALVATAGVVCGGRL